ncbi:MAG: class I SAM-dependent methyltransferase [Verrucomicrobia bacterium]|nr:MAG: class I SAM-dependent methyltransferase [Verrucomicrobiota bacterium]
MQRKIQPELLDVLPPDDPRAMRSRRDLRRVNAWMRNSAIAANALASSANGNQPRSILDLGAGDGSFLLRVAQRLAPTWSEINARLLDRQDVISPETLSGFQSLHWTARATVAEVSDWLEHRQADSEEAVIANLFLHHFSEPQISLMFRELARTARLFVAVEPHRGNWPLFCTHLLWLIGCNTVTEHDAAVSVRAGFAGHELSVLWPQSDEWILEERRAGLFSHLFVARRKS